MFFFYLKILVIALLPPQHQTEAFYHIPLSNSQSIGARKQHNGSVSLSFYQFRVEQFNKAPTNS